MFRGILAFLPKKQGLEGQGPKSVRKVSFSGLFDLFGTFLRLRAGRPGKTFWRLFFAVFGPEGLETAVDGRQGRNILWDVVNYRRRTNVQQLTCKIDLSSSFYYLFLSFVLLELKPFVLKGKVPGEKLWKSVKNCEKVWKIMKRFCPLVVAL